MGEYTVNVIQTDERILHILEGHRKDYEQNGKYIPDAIASPDVILEDCAHPHTAMFIRHIEETNINVAVKIAYADEHSDRESSVITMYRLREQNQEKLMRKHVVICKR